MPSSFAQKWAILFGVSKYENVGHLKYSIKDISEVGTALRNSLDFPDSHILEFGDGLKNPPELTEFWILLARFLERAHIGQDDLLLFYFSGHGYRNKKDYLLPIEASLDDLKHTGIPVDDLIERLTATGCNNVVTILDACREIVPGAKGSVGIGRESKTLMERAGVVSIFSCAPTQQSWEIDALEHSSFTYCLLEGIRSATYTTVGQMYDYLLPEVPVLNKRHKKPLQQPYAAIAPVEKKELPVFARTGRGHQSAAHYNRMFVQLLDFAEREEIEVAHYAAAVELLLVVVATAEGGGPAPALTLEEGRRLKWITLLCGGKLTPKVFTKTWDTMDQRPQAGAVTTGLKLA